MDLGAANRKGNVSNGQNVERSLVGFAGRGTVIRTQGIALIVGAVPGERELLSPL